MEPRAVYGCRLTVGLALRDSPRRRASGYLGPWFGNGEKVNGLVDQSVTSAGERQVRLLDKMADEPTARVDVVVLDLSWPNQLPKPSRRSTKLAAPETQYNAAARASPDPSHAKKRPSTGSGRQRGSLMTASPRRLAARDGRAGGGKRKRGKQIVMATRRRDRWVCQSLIAAKMPTGDHRWQHRPILRVDVAGSLGRLPRRRRQGAPQE